MSTTTTDVRVQPQVLECAERAWFWKEECTKHEDHWELPTMVALIKDGQVILEVVIRGTDRDRGLAVADMLSMPADPDAIVMTSDAHTTKVVLNPKTGQPWGPGEMQAMCDDEGACSTGLLTDCLITVAVFRDGHVETVTRPYHGHEKAGGMVWDDAYHVVAKAGDTALTGYINDRLARSMQLAGGAGAKAREHVAELAAEMDDGPTDPQELYWVGLGAMVQLCFVADFAVAAHANPPAHVQEQVQASFSEERLLEAGQRLGPAAVLLQAHYGISN